MARRRPLSADHAARVSSSARASAESRTAAAPYTAATAAAEGRAGRGSGGEASVEGKDLITASFPCLKNTNGTTN